MLLNSYQFIFFFIVLFFLYFKIGKNYRIQNILLLIGSIVFYCSWSCNFLFLLFGTILITYFIGKKILDSQEKHKKWWLRLGIFTVLLQLLYFKYFNFFIHNFNDFLQIFGLKSQLKTLTILLPIGISFYSFRMIGFLMDIKNKKLKTIPSLLDYSVFVSYFPAIISGPIDRAMPFLNQLKVTREFSAAVFSDGLRQLLWGLFKKLVIADNVATITSGLFGSYTTVNGSALLIGAVLYLIQLYADFSGYSDMSIGISKLLGIRVNANFNFPLFAQNAADFWRRWHISLTSWLTDYVFTPLSITFRYYDKLGLILAIIINFLIIGFWHGAEWHYIFFGLIAGLMYIPLILSGKMNKKNKSEYRLIPTFRELINMVFTFFSFSLLMILFFVKDLEMATQFYSKIFSKSLFQIPNFPFQKEVAALILMMILIEWIGRNKEFAIKEMFHLQPRIIRWGFYYLLVFLIFLFYIAPKGYIYAQF